MVVILQLLFLPVIFEILIVIQGQFCLQIAYGLTETSPASNATTREDPVDLRVSTVGRPLPFVEVIYLRLALNLAEKQENKIVEGFNKMITAKGFFHS